MGNSYSSDEIDNECPDENTSKVRSSKLSNEMNIGEVMIPSDKDSSENTESSKINVVRIGSYHQPVKVTKIKSINGPKVNKENLEAASRLSRDYYKSRDVLQGKCLEIS